MQKWNIKHISLYTIMILAIVLSSLLISSITEDENFIRMYQKLTFAVPVLFIIAAFLAFKITETRIVLIALSFLVLSLSGPLMQLLLVSETPEISDQLFDWLFSPVIWFKFLKILPFLMPLSLCLMFLIPEKIGRISMSFLKVIVTLLPFVYVLFPNNFDFWFLEKFQYGRFLLPWPSIAAAFLPLAGPLLYHDRRSGTFSAALTSALVLSMLPMMLSFNDFHKDTSFLFTGIIILHSLYRVYWENSYIDELTGLSNRRALDEKLRKLRSGYALSMVDIDHFKNFNDTYGHDEGDNVLRLVARILNTQFGKSAFRYGGEEFCIVFMKTSVKSAFIKMDEARAAIDEHMFSIRKHIKNRKKSGRKNSISKTKKVKLTVSAGIAAPVKSTRDAVAVLKNADKALYVAKENGRNRVEMIKIRK